MAGQAPAMLITVALMPSPCRKSLIKGRMAGGSSSLSSPMAPRSGAWPTASMASRSCCPVVPILKCHCLPRALGAPRCGICWRWGLKSLRERRNGSYALHIARRRGVAKSFGACRARMAESTDFVLETKIRTSRGRSPRGRHLSDYGQVGHRHDHTPADAGRHPHDRNAWFDRDGAQGQEPLQRDFSLRHPRWTLRQGSLPRSGSSPDQACSRQAPGESASKGFVSVFHQAERRWARAVGQVIPAMVRSRPYFCVSTGVGRRCMRCTFEGRCQRCHLFDR